jgi:hypothetical protein
MALYTLYVQYAGRPPETKSFDKETIVLGRDVGDIALLDPQVSGRHAEMRFQNGKLVFQDLGSTNGSFMPSGERISAPVELGIGNAVRVGQSVITVQHIDFPGAVAQGKTMFAGAGSAPPAPGGFAAPSAPPLPGLGMNMQSPQPQAPAPAPAPQAPAPPAPAPQAPAPQAPAPQGGMPGQPGGMPGQPGGMPGQPGGMPGQPGQYGGQPGGMPGQPAPYGGQPGYGAQPVQQGLQQVGHGLDQAFSGVNTDASAEGAMADLKAGVSLVKPHLVMVVALVGAPLILPFLFLWLGGFLSFFYTIGGIFNIVWLAMPITLAAGGYYLMRAHLGMPVGLGDAVKAVTSRGTDTLINIWVSCFIGMIALWLPLGFCVVPILFLENRKFFDNNMRNLELLKTAFGRAAVPWAIATFGGGVALGILTTIFAFIPFAGGLLSALVYGAGFGLIYAVNLAVGVRLYFELRKQLEGGDPEAAAKQILQQIDQGMPAGPAPVPAGQLGQPQQAYGQQQQGYPQQQQGGYPPQQQQGGYPPQQQQQGGYPPQQQQQGGYPPQQQQGGYPPQQQQGYPQQQQGGYPPQQQQGGYPPQQQQGGYPPQQQGYPQQGGGGYPPQGGGGWPGGQQ